MIYIFDIDGTLADLSHRLHFIQNDPQDWDSFFAACEADSPILDVIELAAQINKTHALVFVTGRSDAVRDQTARWLYKFGLRGSSLYMRKAGDHRQDSVVKSELLDQLREDFGETIIAGVFEDRKQVVDMYRAKGLRVFQVAEGNF